MTLLALVLTTSIALLVRSAKTKVLMLASTTAMSNEVSPPGIGTMVLRVYVSSAERAATASRHETNAPTRQASSFPLVDILSSLFELPSNNARFRLAHIAALSSAHCIGK